MDKRVEKYTGAVSVEGDITPTTREPIQKVESTDWNEMSVSDLWTQRYTLQNRIAYAYESGHPEMAKHIMSGIQTIDQIIAQRQSFEEPTLF